MDEGFQYEGYWWLPGVSDNRVPGLTEISPYWPQAPSAGSPSRSSPPTTMPPNPDYWTIVSDSKQQGTVVPPTQPLILRKRPGAPRKT